jgi:hypothetical protein
MDKKIELRRSNAQAHARLLIESPYKSIVYLYGMVIDCNALRRFLVSGAAIRGS